MSELLDQDATSQILALASKRISAVELLKASLARHAETHDRLNAVVAADPERALERARALDDARVRGEPMGPLAGLPMTVKDTFDVSGMAASSGLAEFRRPRTPPRSATPAAQAR
jgi:amidase